MKTEELKPILSWLRGTDLVEVCFREGEKGFSLSSAQAPAEIAEPRISDRYVAATSPGVGILQWNAPGRARKVEEGAEVSAGDIVALVEQGPRESIPVKAPASGRVARVFAEGGSAVDFGRLLFFVEPAAQP